MPSSTEIDQADDVQKCKDGYLLIGSEKVVDPLLDRTEASGEIDQAISNFAANIRSTILAASMPFIFVRQAIIDRRFQSILTAERIRALNPADVVQGRSELTEASAKATLKSAQNRLLAELADDKAQENIRLQIRAELARGLEDPDTSQASQELLNMGMVGTWAAFEVFSKDIAKAVVNRNPRKGVDLLSSEKTKHYFGGKSSIHIDIFSDYGFDLSVSMGDAIFKSRKLDSLSIICDIFDVIYEESESLAKLLKCDTIKELSARRNLFVHKKGIVDDLYVKSIKSNEQIGQQIHVKGHELEDYLITVRNLALEISKQARGC